MLLQFLAEQVSLKKLLPDPQRYGHAKGPEPLGSERQVGFEQSLKLKEGFVVEGDVIDTAGAAGLQAIPYGVMGKPRIVLLARETLFLRGSLNAAVLYQRGRAVVIESGYAEDAHPRTRCK